MLRIINATNYDREFAWSKLYEIEMDSFDGQDIMPREHFDSHVAKTFFLVEDEEFIGVYSWALDFEYALGEPYLYTIAVYKYYQGNGYSKILMESFLKKPFDRKPDTHCLHVKETNHVAISLYKRYGFVEAGREDDFYEDGTRAILMRRKNED